MALIGSVICGLVAFAIFADSRVRGHWFTRDDVRRWRR